MPHSRIGAVASGFYAFAALALVVALGGEAPGAAGPDGKDAPWVKLPSVPTQENLYAVHGLQRDAVWVAGDNGTIYRWNGQSWEKRPVESGAGVRINAIHMFGLDSGWAAGHTASGRGRLFRFDGSSWKPAFTTESDGTDFTSLAFMDRQDGLAGTGHGKLFRFDGRTWAEVTTRTLERATGERWYLTNGVRAIHDLTVDRNRKLYVGAATWTGTKGGLPYTEAVTLGIDYSRAADPAFVNSPNPKGVAPVSPGTERVFMLPGGRVQFLACDANAVYLTNIVYELGRAEHGEKMFRVNLNDATLRDLWMLSPDEGWLAGQNGTVIRLKPGQDTVAYWPVDEHLNALWMLDADIGFVVGDKGTALARNTAAMLEFKLSPDKQSYAWGAPVSLVLQKLNPQGAAALNGYYWEIKRSEQKNGKTKWTTVYTSPKNVDREHMENSVNKGAGGVIHWDQKDSLGKYVAEGDYHAYVHVGDRTPATWFTVLPPVRTTDKPDPVAAMSGLTLTGAAETFLNLRTSDFVLSKTTPGTASLEGASFIIEQKVGGLWQRFSASQPGFLSAKSLTQGGTATFSWNNVGGTTNSQAPAGDYRIRFSAPKAGSGELTREFTLRTRGGLASDPLTWRP